MPINATLPELAIDQINSLGGPPLPTGLPATSLKVLLENIAASQPPTAGCRVAAMLAARRF